MMGNFLKSLSRKKTLATMGLAAMLVGTTFYVQDLSQTIKKLSVVQNGIGTCFSRVNQTYTAKLLGDSESLYLDEGFKAVTEECFGETMAKMEESFEKILASPLKKLNTLASDVHWFQEKIQSESSSQLGGTNSNVLISNIGSRFEKLEISQDEILASVDDFKEEVNETLSSLKVVFYLVSTLLPFVMIWEYLERRAISLLNKRVEIEAVEELESERISNSKVEEIIKAALEQNELIYCSKLFTNYQVGQDSKVDFAAVVPGQVQTVSMNGKLEDQIEQIWEQSEKDVSLVVTEEEQVQDLETFHLDTHLTKVIDMMANKLLGEGLIVDINVDPLLYIFAKEEELGQVFYHVLMNSIKSCHDSENSKKVTISSKTLGNTVLLSFENSGSGFSEEFVRAQVGLDQKEKQDYLGIGLKICDEFMAEQGGSISFANQKDDNEVVGGKILLVFKKALIEDAASTEEVAVQISHIQKGTKKEMMAEMEEMNRLLESV